MDEGDRSLYVADALHLARCLLQQDDGELSRVTQRYQLDATAQNLVVALGRELLERERSLVAGKLFLAELEPEVSRRDRLEALWDDRLADLYENHAPLLAALNEAIEVAGARDEGAQGEGP